MMLHQIQFRVLLKIFLGNLACNSVQNGCCNLTNYQRKRNGVMLLLQFSEVQQSQLLRVSLERSRRVHSLNGRLVRMNRVLLIFLFSDGLP